MSKMILISGFWCLLKIIFPSFKVNRNSDVQENPFENISFIPVR